MVHRVLFGGDLHKRATDITTIEGYVKCTEAVQQALMREIEKYNIEYFIHLGDWYDRGYSNDVASSLYDYDLDLRMNNLLKGKFYGLIGNHIRLGMDSNPELHLIQPHPIYKSRRIINREEQVIKTPDYLRVGNVQISFQHHVMEFDSIEMYKPERKDWATFHVALFHTPLIVPNAQLMNTTYGFNVSSNTAIARTLENVDLAIVGDIHAPIGKFQVERMNGVTTVVVPGSLTNTDASEANRHTDIALPMLTIDDEKDTVSVSFLPFNLLTNMVTFRPKNRERNIEKIKSLRGKNLQDLHDTEEIVTALGNRDDAVMSLNAYMKVKGYTKRDKDIIRAVIKDPQAVEKVVDAYLEG